MKNIIKIVFLLFATFFFVACEAEFDPQGSTITKDQAANAPGAYNNFVNTVTSTLAGEFIYSGKNHDANDFGYPAFYLERDVMGQDIFQCKNNWFNGWYTASSLSPTTANAQIPWTHYYSWIKNCNTVIGLAGENPKKDKIIGAGIAYAMRAMFYMDLARMFAAQTYGKDKSAETVPIVTEKTTLKDLTHNPRLTNEAMWKFIISDLNKAEIYLKDYKRENVYTPDVSVVYGLKARAYLVMEDWSNAEKYAKEAQTGYNIMSNDQYTDREKGFNSSNSSWMLGCSYKADSPNILENDADSSWGSMMILEINPKKAGAGYASNYGQYFLIDRHLYESIPKTDSRKKCFIDFAIDQLEKKAAIKALEDYSDYPDWVYETGHNAAYDAVGGMSLKFRANGGEEGHNNQYVGFTVDVPMMRVEEMYLIEAEAAGRQSEAKGINLLTIFAKKRDNSYTYGQHNEAYGNASTSAFVNEIWWQRRVEFWGEGMATFDIKRLSKGIIRSYENTNHIEGYRWNLDKTPDWMNLCIVQTETNYNNDCTNNPTPIAPKTDSPKFDW